MNEPKRLLDDDARSAFDRAALRSASMDRPSDRARGAAQIALGIGVGATITTAGSSAAAAATTVGGSAAVATTKVGAWAAIIPTLAKVGVAVVIAGAAVTVVVQRRGEGSPARTVSTATDGRESRGSRAPAREHLSPSPTAEQTPAPEPSVDLGSIPVEALPAAPGSAVPVVPRKELEATAPEAPASAPAPRSTLTDEIAAVDAARAKLHAGNAGGAKGDLETYMRAYPDGSLRREAHVLLVDAHLATGDRAAARREAETYLTRYPTSPAAPRLRGLLETLSSKTP